MRTAAAKRSTGQKAVIDGLAEAVHGITSPFVCGGSLLTDEPVSLRFRDGCELAVKPAERPFEQEAANQMLIARCTPAPYGKGRRTRYDRTVRDALQLNAEGGTFSVLHFDPASAGVLDQIRRQLAPADPNPISAELYALNIYGRDGHFRPHKDTPRGDDMLGTLIVCLPSRFSAGQLVVHHRGAFEVFDWGREIDEQPAPNRVRWAAFFGDVDHAVERVWWGSRVTVSYLLRRGQGAVLGHASGSEQTERLLAQRLLAALANPKFMPKGGVLAFPCFHQYSHDERFQKRHAPLTRRTALTLKGRDLLVAQAAIDLQLPVALRPYMIETCADQTWELERFPTDRERDGLRDRMDFYDIEHSLPVAGEATYVDDLPVTWVIRPPVFNEVPHFYGHDGGEPRPPNAEIPALEYVHACEYSATGYFGNEASDTEFYVYAALQVTIPPFGERAHIAGTTASETKAASAKKPAAKRRG